MPSRAAHQSIYWKNGALTMFGVGLLLKCYEFNKEIEDTSQPVVASVLKLQIVLSLGTGEAIQLGDIFFSTFYILSNKCKSSL